MYLYASNKDKAQEDPWFKVIITKKKQNYKTEKSQIINQKKKCIVILFHLYFKRTYYTKLV